MRAVFKCIAGAYWQLGYWEVNGVTPVYGKSIDEELAVYRATHIVGNEIKLPELEEERAKFYLFSEGKNHNQLTLTDAKEIYNMRKWIQCRDTDFIEVSCDEEAEHITEALFIKAVEVHTEEPVKATKPQEEYTEWDTKYSRMLKNR